MIVSAKKKKIYFSFGLQKFKISNQKFRKFIEIRLLVKKYGNFDNIYETTNLI